MTRETDIARWLQEEADLDQEMGDALPLNPPLAGWLSHDIQRDDKLLLWRCSRCQEAVTYEQDRAGRWFQIERMFTPLCPVWPEEGRP